MSEQSTLYLALINAGVLIAIAVLFLVIHLRGGLKPRRSAGAANPTMLMLGIGFLVAAVIGVLLMVMRGA